MKIVIIYNTYNKNNIVIMIIMEIMLIDIKMI